MTSPARFPTKRRKWAGSHSRRLESDQVVPPPDRRTVVGRLEESVTIEATEGSVGADAPAEGSLFADELLIVLLSDREPKGAVLALVAEELPSKFEPMVPKRRLRLAKEEESLSFDA